LHATFATFSIFACYFSQLFATFAENKCNFLALLLQQKLALVISEAVLGSFWTCCVF